jgi:hypothetical protein
MMHKHRPGPCTLRHPTRLQHEQALSNPRHPACPLPRPLPHLTPVLAPSLTTTIPASLCSMNKLAELPPSLSALASLAQLALSINPLRRLPPGLGGLPCLTMLELYYVQLDGLEGLEELRRALPRCAGGAAGVCWCAVAAQ